MVSDAQSMAAWLREWYPECEHLLDRQDRIRAMFRDKWPVIGLYFRYCTLVEASHQEPMVWERFKHVDSRRQALAG